MTGWSSGTSRRSSCERRTSSAPRRSSEQAMHELTERVILTALGDWEDFAEYSAHLKLAVNAPVSALVQLPIPRMLHEARPRASNWPGLILEVTEDQIISDLDLANDVADAL